jgi:hypothetical protein
VGGAVEVSHDSGEAQLRQAGAKRARVRARGPPPDSASGAQVATNESWRRVARVRICAVIGTAVAKSNRELGLYDIATITM